MKIAIITPTYIPTISGNATTVNRLVLGLKSRKVAAKVIDLSKSKNKENLIKNIKKFNPDIIQGFHAFKSGIIALEIARKLEKPLIITITGTDANHDLFNKERKYKVIEVLNNAKKLVVFHIYIKRKLLNEMPNLNSKLAIIKQSVLLERKKFNLRKNLKLSNRDFIFLLPAAIRKIKYKNFYIDIFKKIHSEYNNIKVILCGPILENDFASNFFAKAKKFDWLYYLEKIPHDKMYYAIKSADAVLNTSISEGGMSNSILEAMSVGKPVLASEIEGNKSIIKNNVNGFLYKNKKVFYKKAVMLIKNGKLRKRLGKKAKEIFDKNFSYEGEINSYMKIYSSILPVQIKNSTILHEVLYGLSNYPKTLPSKYFYDEKGSRLFNEICKLDEYYLTRTEIAIMKDYAPEMAKIIGEKCLIIELGCGNSTKISLLLKYLQSPAGYIPIDISKEAMIGFIKILQKNHQNLSIMPIFADFSEEVEIPYSKIAHSKRVVYFPGSTIGNFNGESAYKLLEKIHRICGSNGSVLVGIDLKKNKQTLESAYNDKKGITAAFNLNILSHINSALGADFNLQNFRHKAAYNEKYGRIEMHLISKCRQKIKISNKIISFDENEAMLTEISCKYTIDEFKKLVSDFFEVQKVWMDEGKKFSVLHLKAN